MNLLEEQWIPVRPLPSGAMEKTSLRQLLCEDRTWELCLPRDDMELAAMQLLICITQVLFTPTKADELKRCIAKPMMETEYDAAMQPFADCFRLDHPKHPFMQVRGIEAKKVTPMDKLMAGLTGSENCRFVNEPGLASQLCDGCAAIALFNQASCSPSFGGGSEGGFKPGLRGSSPITTLMQGGHLRQTIWLNVLYKGQLDQRIPWYYKAKFQKPTWVEPIKRGENIYVQQIGLIRGLLWQPAHVELIPPEGGKLCTCCGLPAKRIYKGFRTEQFGFNVIGTWPHPHSPRIMMGKQGEIEERFATFRSSAPSWTQLNRFIIRRKFSDVNTRGQQPAAAILQARQTQMYGNKTDCLHLLIGGYRTSKASILERCHDVFTLNHGWDKNTKMINDFVDLALGYRDALYKVLYIFVHGIKATDNEGKELKGALRGREKEKIKVNMYFRGANESVPKDKKSRLYLIAENQFFRRSEPTIENTLARIDFAAPEQELASMRKALKRIVEDLFEDSVRPYLQDPELIRTLAVSKRILRKHLNNLEPQQNKGGNNGTATP
jgi:CRISPR system Cascade subunit CasA